LSETKIGIIIPAFNPKIQLLQDLIFRILVACEEYMFYILLVDDGSTPAIPIDIIKFNQLNIIRHHHNLGKGAALKSGFRYFLEDEICDVVLTLDADLQHLP
jgi:glycosyltransferase involved in cell wall biosynthesis